MAMPRYPKKGIPPGAKPMMRCDISTRKEPTIIQRVAFPRMSTKDPKMGVKIMVVNGISDTIRDAISLSISNRGIIMDVANLLKDMIHA